MKNILYLHSSSDLYGSDRSLLRTVHALDRTQFTPFVCLPYDGPLVSELRREGIVTFVFDLGVIRRKMFSPLGLLRTSIAVGLALIKILGIIHSHKIDILHSNTAAVILGGITAKLTGKKHIWHVREIIVEPAFVRKFIAFTLYRLSTIVVGVSDSVIDNLAIDQPKIRSKAIVIHNGLDVELYRHGNRENVRRELMIGKGEILVGMIGRVNHWKGQDLFVEVAKKICARYQNVTFFAVGSPFQGQESEMAKLFSLVADSGLNSKFIISEFRNDIKDLLAAFDVFILPSTLPDPFPTTVLEAMAASKPIVANAHGGVVQMIVNGTSGFLITPNDANQMADKVSAFINDKELRDSYGKAAFLRVNELYSVETYLKNISHLYQSI